MNINDYPYHTGIPTGNVLNRASMLCWLHDRKGAWYIDDSISIYHAVIRFKNEGDAVTFKLIYGTQK